MLAAAVHLWTSSARKPVYGGSTPGMSRGDTCLACLRRRRPRASGHCKSSSPGVDDCGANLQAIRVVPRVAASAMGLSDTQTLIASGRTLSNYGQRLRALRGTIRDAPADADDSRKCGCLRCMGCADRDDLRKQDEAKYGRGIPNHSVGRLRQGWRAPPWSGGETPVGDEP